MTDTTVSNDYTAFDTNTIDTEEVTTQKQNRLKHMLGTVWFWVIFAGFLLTALFVRLYQAGKDAYTGDWNFGRSMSAFPAMFGGFGSLLACLAFLGGLIGTFFMFYSLAKRNQNALAALLSMVCIAIAGFIGWTWINIDVTTALGFVFSLIAIFAAAFVAGLAVVNSHFYTVPNRKAKPVRNATDNEL